MENLALIDSFSEFKDEKLIDRVTLMVILEEVFRNTLKRKFGSDDNFDIIINPDKGDLEIWRNRIVVADGEVEDPNQEIELTVAQKIEPDFEVGEDVSEEVKLIDLGRRSILSLRQNLIAKIYEHDSNNIFKQFKELEGAIYTAFTGIKLFTGIQVKLIPSNENKMVLSGENFETVVVTLNKDVLRIKHSIDQIFNPKNTYIEVYFSTPLDLIHTYQGSIIESQAVLQATKIELKAREGSAIDLHIESEKISSSVNSGSTLSLRGVSVNHELKILGGGICESENLITEQTTVKVTAGGVAYIHASDLLEATVNVGGTVRIHGRPTKLIKRKRIGGTITEMN